MQNRSGDEPVYCYTIYLMIAVNTLRRFDGINAPQVARRYPQDYIDVESVLRKINLKYVSYQEK